jgi:hypothetical protein
MGLFTMAETVTRGGKKGHIERVAAYEKFVPAKYDTGGKSKKKDR